MRAKEDSQSSVLHRILRQSDILIIYKSRSF